MISASLLHSWIAQIKAKHQVIIFDSGWTDTVVTTFRSYVEQESRSVQNETDKDMVVLASTGPGKEVNSHGALTAAIISGLSGQAAFGRETVTARSLEAYLHTQLLGELKQYAATLAQGDDFPLALIPQQASAEKGPSRGTELEAEPSKSSDTPAASPSPALPVQYALLFATDQYDYWPTLKNPVADVTAIAKELREYYGFQVDVVANPTRDQVVDKLREYRKKPYGKGDELVLFFAGHGSFDEEQQRGFVITKDSKREDPNHNTQIPQSDLREIVDSIPARHIFVVMDVCFGAAFDPSMGGSMHRGDDEYGKISGSELFERKLSLATRQFLTSGSKEYVPDGRPGQNSPFARAFLEALRTYGGPDGLLTLARLRPHFELLKTVPRMGDFGHDEPGSEFFFIADPKLRSAALATEAGRRWQP